jgi:folate-dependent phosphoribosylglycinamide formyltransferase PurN
MTRKKIRTALLISGGGTTAEAVIKASQKRKLAVLPAVVISSRPDAGGLEKAQALDIPTEVVSRSPGKTLLRLCQQYQVDLVSQNGWLPKTPPNVIRQYQGRIINQHPGPLDEDRPDFGGQGMYGSRVTCARLAYLSYLAQHHQLTKEDYYTEAVTHHVNNKYDQGSLIRVTQLKLTPLIPLKQIASLVNNPKLLKKTTLKVQAQLLPLEHQNVINTLSDFARGHVPHYTRPQPLIPSDKVKFLKKAKKLTIKLFPKG